VPAQARVRELELQLARHAANLHDMALQLGTAVVECKLLANAFFS